MCVMYNLVEGGEPSMKRLSFAEFRKKASEILTLVEKGETVRVIRHGKTVAKIVPLNPMRKFRHGSGPVCGWSVPVRRSARRFWRKGGGVPFRSALPSHRSSIKLALLSTRDLPFE